MARKLKKEIKKRVPFKIEADANGLRPWPDFPQQLINMISRQFSTLTLDISYGGVTKSWRTQTKQCNSQAMMQQRRLELHDVNEDKKFKCNSAFHQGEWIWNFCDAKIRPIPAPWKYYVGYSDRVLVSRGALPNEYYLHFPEAGDSYHLLPSWDQRIPFRRVVISSSTRFPLWRMNSIVMVLTGTTRPALLFYRKNEGAEYAWMKQDSTIPDPNCNSYKSERNQFMRFTNAIAHKGKFYALSLHGTLAVIEDIESQPRITALGPKRAVPSVYSRHFKECLLESDGEILLIFLISRKSINVVDDVEVFRLNVNTLSWIKIKRLEGDRAVFLGSNCCMSVSASKMGCESDCVYFSHHIADDWWVYDLQRGSISLCRSDAILPRVLPLMLNEQEKEL